MISLLMALAAAAQAAPAAPAESGQYYRDCLALVKSDAKKAVSVASEWRIRGGGVSARQCLGLGYAADERWASAATAFEQAAQQAETEQDRRAPDLWAQSGNGWLAADEAAKARQAFDSALASPGLAAARRGQVHLDRARAAVALNDLTGARSDVDKGLELVPAEPMAWYLSAALALREGRMDRAGSDIAKAVELAPADPDILLQAGTIAGTAGDIESARAYYARAAKAAPQSESGKAAQAALSADASLASSVAAKQGR